MREETLNLSRYPNVLPPKQRSYYFDGLLYVLLFLLASFAIIYSFAIDKHLSADGTEYLTTVLETGNFTKIAWSRQVANYLTQWPLVIAVTLGLKDVPLLSKVYGFGLYFPYIASFTLCIYALRRENSFLLVFPLISIIGINLSTDYVLVGEHHVMVLLSWPILLLSLRREPLTWLDGCLLWILLALFSRTYESAIAPAIIFSAIFATKLYQTRRSKKQVVIHSLSLFLSSLTFLIALYFILLPRDSTNRSSFMLEIVAPLKNPVALVAATFAFCLTAGLLFRKTSILLFSLFPLTLYSCLVLFSEHGLTASRSFASRTLSLTLLSFLLICTIISHYYHIKPNRTSTRVLIVFALVMVLGNLRFSSNWYNFRQQVIDTVTTNNGYIPMEETVIKDNPYRWGWNNPGLGIILSYPCVKAILLNPSDIKWEPFDPRSELILKDYISYNDFFQKVDKDIKICK